MIFGASRLLARVLKEDVQIWYNDTSTVKRGGGGGVEKTFLWKTFEVYVTSCQYVFQLARSKFWLCEFCAAMLLYLITTFSFSQVHHQIDQNVKCIIIMIIEACVFAAARDLKTNKIHNTSQNLQQIFLWHIIFEHWLSFFVISR